MTTKTPLFAKQDLGTLLQAHENKMYQEIDSLEPNRLLNTSPSDLAGYFEQEYVVQAPRLKEDEIAADQKETMVDVSQDRNRAIFDRSQPFLIRGTAVSYFVPFDGDQQLFCFQPSTFTYRSPHAVVKPAELVLEYITTSHDAEAIRSEYERDLGEIKRYLQWVTKDVGTFNQELPNKIRARIEARRSKLLKDQGLAANLGVPLRRRADAPTTYAVPTTRRKSPIPTSRASTNPYVPEPVLADEEYEHILSVVKNMVAVIERSPEAFKDMGEEDLRQHFLVQLNGHYEGKATGETFNYEGKTDILIRHNGRNIFIAECKFWGGAKEFGKIVDQLLGYSSWRDTKVAIILFNRNKNFSSVLNQIPALIEGHQNYKRGLKRVGETEFRSTFAHRDDPNRELTLTVLAFDVPSSNAEK